MLQFNPSFLSPNYEVEGASRPSALEFYWGSEQGAICFGSERLEVAKHGWMSGHWTLEEGGALVAEAFQNQPFSRTFRVAEKGCQWTLEPILFSRQFEIYEADQLVGLIAPNHCFTRQSRLECHDSIGELMQMFCFWLVALTWRRD